MAEIAKKLRSSDQLKYRRRTTALTLRLMVLPGLVMILLFIVYPIVRSIILSFDTWPGVGSATFVGLQNYRTLFANPDFWVSLRNNLVICVVTTLFSIALGTTFAAAIHRNVPGARLFKVAYFLPYIIPAIIVTVFWELAFQPTGGIVNTLLGALHLGSNYVWLGSPNAALFVVIFVNIWFQAGFCMIFVLAAMDGIPPEIEAAARLDGVNAFQNFFSILVPISREVLVTIAMLEMLFSFRQFTVVWGLTQGGPGTATSVLDVLLYKQAFIFTNFGLGSAIAVVSTVVVGLMALLFIVVFRPAAITTGEG
ncbi:carbohydrate ABC transporter permease [Ktedonobacter racemifer]|uniref:Binding-protein-dependent transport systems inner membrane component n=1 Tax=Ktedonobacter racemifer DSM 44963 TaxID=485913 RepID=D6TGC1_KTERA|nr:sugar ABC transporter permease [Ktedonobacter racemifer]EFH88823.1 binding-protein-dependent transport systems inner membrane component [Ktedonobacter racemifer DSM 44963]